MNEDPVGEGSRPGRPLLARITVDIRPLRECRDFRRLWFGTGISAIGSQITVVAIPFQVYAITDSTAIVGLLGLVAVVCIGGTVLLAFLLPALVRYDSRKPHAD